MSDNFLVKGLAHIGVYTDDCDKCVKFYTEVLNFESYYEYTTDTGTELKFVRAGNMVVEFVGVGNTPTPGTVDHIAIEVQGLDEIVKKVVATGATMCSENIGNMPGLFPTGSRMMFFIGPAGERIELYEYSHK